ncbi:hypothetical protein IB232_04705 [Pseudomonas sp. PDM15]|jgi:hypothetical protein|uniref:hypothetical protein n=1 Tax=Pseudomonas sp. PDM15 TaxID=2769303 RepID=UPI001782C675|nr:hypothetical protein [Pseudomonas sp. PDM15]MBD9424610.1 hypothetical protein [Pseudomonas sp. PDM15]
MNSLARRHLLWLFLAGSLLSLGAGVLLGRPQAPLDLECGGRSALLLPGNESQQWLVVRYDLDLRAEGLGDFKARLRLLDVASGQDSGYQHRATRFSHQRRDQRLLLQVLHSGSSQTGDLAPEKLAGLGLFLFNEQLHLSYPLRRIGPDSLLIDTGQGGAVFCTRHPSRS